MKKPRSKVIFQHIQEKYEDLGKYLDGATKKLNKILQKAIRNGLKSLYLDELEFVHDALNTSMAQRQGRPSTPGRKSSEDLENIITVQEQRIESLMRRLDNYRQHSSDQEKRILDYSQKVQRFGTSVGLLDMKVESLQYENKQLRDLVSYEKEKSRKLEEILKSVLDNCKCTRKWVLQQNYPGLQKT
uniref:Uncharacterized protein n=1 Tax=Cuerna arida TaxID=1464854 RepID=A0A1B6H4W0_9HEMI